MPSLPAPTQTDQVIQNKDTGVVDFLKYQGNQLVSSSSHDYGLGSDFKIVASGNVGAGNELIAQSKTTGQLDFLKINANGDLTASFMTTGSLPSVKALGFYGGSVLVSQLDNGQLDFLQYNGQHQLTASNLIANTVGLPTLVGSGFGGMFNNAGQFNGLSTTSDSLLTQLSDGTLDGIGISGNTFGTLAYTSSFLLPQTTGSAKAVATNQAGGAHSNIPGAANTSGVQVFTQSDSGFDAFYLDSGNNTATKGALYASNHLQSYAGWNVVDGGEIAASIFPIA